MAKLFLVGGQVIAVATDNRAKGTLNKIKSTLAGSTSVPDSTSTTDPITGVVCHKFLGANKTERYVEQVTIKLNTPLQECT